MAVPVELSISNICWPDGQAAHTEAIHTLTEMDVPSIDIAPTKVWPKIVGQGPQSVTAEDVSDFMNTLEGRKVAGFQSLTFKTPGQIFEGTREDYAALTERMHGVIDLAALVGAQTLIYGSPGTRKLPGGMNGLREIMRGHEFFGKLAAHAYNRGVILGIEPVSTTWTDNHPVFGRSGKDVYNFSDTFNDPDAVYTPPVLVPDTFAMHDSGENAWGTILIAAQGARLAPHWQISERGMGPVGGATEIDHATFASALYEVADNDRGSLLVPGKNGGMDLYDGPITVAVEMFPDTTISVADSVARAVNFVRAKYPVVQ
jgi:hypothetical protein